MKKLFLGLVIVAIVLLAPFGVKKIVNNSLADKKTELNSVGIEFNILNEAGYFKSHREFEVKINDVAKFQNFLKNKAVEINKAFKPVVKDIDITKQKDIDEIKNIVFRGEIENSNIVPFSKIKSTAYLASVPKPLMSDKKMKEIIKERTLSFDLIFSFFGKLEKVALKDIALKDKFLLSGSSFKNKTDDKNIAGVLSIDKIDLISKKKNEEVLFDKINYDFTYKNYMENSGNLSVNSFFIGDIIKVDKLNSKSSGYEKGKSYIGDMNLNFADANIKLERKVNIDINNLDLNINLSDFNSKNIKELNDLYYKSFLAGFYVSSPQDRFKEMMQYQIDLMKVMNEFLNYGGAIKANLAFDKMTTPMFLLNNPKLDLSIKLNKNKLVFSMMKKEELLKYVDLDINLKLKEKEYETISKLFRLQMLDNYVKFENNEAIFKVKTINNQIDVNGKAINL